MFLSLFFIVMMLATLPIGYVLAGNPGWHEFGALLLFFGLLTLVNAPFDWFAIGLTRALLRRGLAPGGFGPYVYSIVDIAISVPVIVILALTTVVSIQTFDDFAAFRAGDGARILPLGPIFDGLETRPTDYEFWWIWFMLFSTLIPSFLNLVIGAAAFLRGFPGVDTWILRRMPYAGPMSDGDRLVVACALAGHIVGGMLITGLLFCGLMFYVVPLGLPWLASFVRDVAEQVAAFNAPARLMIWWAGVR